MMERYMNKDHGIVLPILLFLLLSILAVSLVFSSIMFFAENYGVFMALLGLFMIYKYMFFNGPLLSLLFKDIAEFGIGVLLFIIGGLFIYSNGVTFQNFINLFV